MATNEQDFLDRIRASRMEDILRIAESTSRTPRPRPGAAEQILSIPAVARINRALQPETPEEMAALLGGSFVAGPAMDVADIGLGALEGDPTRTLFGLAGLALPFVTGTQIRVGSRTLSGRAAEIFKDLLRRSPGSSHEELADVAQRRATVEAERAASAARQSPQREGIASLDPRYSDPDVPEEAMVYRGSEYPEERRARQQAEDGPQPEIPDEDQFTQIDLFGDVEDIPTSVQDASFRNIPIEDPAAREALTLARAEGTPDALTLVSEARPISGETAETLAKSAIRQTPDPRSGDAFEFAAQSIWAQGAESPMAIAEALRKQFPDMSDAEFAYRFPRAIERISETEEVLRQVPRMPPVPTGGEKRFLEALFGPRAGRAQGPLRDNPVMSRGRLTGYSSPRPKQTSLPGLPGIHQVDTRGLMDEGVPVRPVPTRAQILSRPRAAQDQAMVDILDRRFGLFDPERPIKMEVEAPPGSRVVEGRGAQRLSRRDMEDLLAEGELSFAGKTGTMPLGHGQFGRSTQSSIDMNAILNEAMTLPQFERMERSDVIDVLKEALAYHRPRYAYDVAYSTMEKSGRNAARILEDVFKLVDPSTQNPAQVLAQRGSPEGGLRSLFEDISLRAPRDTREAREAFRRKSRRARVREAVLEDIPDPVRERLEVMERMQELVVPTRRVDPEAFERAYSGDPTGRYDPLGQLARGGRGLTPKRAYRLANPDWATRGP